MASPLHKSNHDDTTPFLLKLYYRNGAFHRPEEFASHSPPSHVSIYTWPDCTLYELALELAASNPSAFPNPAIGTRLAFQLVYPDLRNTSVVNSTHPRFAVKDLGSVVIGDGGPGAETSEDVEMNGPVKGSDKDKTLSEAKFVVGDYVSCAILPPLSDGSVAMASSIKKEPSSVSREGRGVGYRGGFQSRENGFGRNGGRGGRGNWRDSIGSGFPMGEWRRGEQPPDGPRGRPRGRGRW